MNASARNQHQGLPAFSQSIPFARTLLAVRQLGYLFLPTPLMQPIYHRAIGIDHVLFGLFYQEVIVRLDHRRFPLEY